MTGKLLRSLWGPAFLFLVGAVLIFLHLVSDGHPPAISPTSAISERERGISKGDIDKLATALRTLCDPVLACEPPTVKIIDDPLHKNTKYANDLHMMFERAGWKPAPIATFYEEHLGHGIWFNFNDEDANAAKFYLILSGYLPGLQTVPKLAVAPRGVWNFWVSPPFGDE